MVNVGDLVEVDQWVPTDSFSSTNNQAAEIAGNSSMADFVGSGKFGATIIDALHSLDLIPAN